MNWFRSLFWDIAGSGQKFAKQILHKSRSPKAELPKVTEPNKKIVLWGKCPSLITTNLETKVHAKQRSFNSWCHLALQQDAQLDNDCQNTPPVMQGADRE